MLILVTLTIHVSEESHYSRQKQIFGALIIDALVLNIFGLLHSLWVFSEPFRAVVPYDMNTNFVLVEKVCSYLLSYYSMIYVMSIFRANAETVLKKILIMIPVAYSVLVFFSGLVTDLFFSFDEIGEVAYRYPQGASVNICLFIYFGYAAFLYFKFGKSLTTEKFLSLILYYVVMMAGIPIRILTKSSSIFEFSVSIALLMCVYTFQNPGEFTDSLSGAGTRNALEFAISTNLLQKKVFTVFGINIERLGVLVGGEPVERAGELLGQITAYLRQLCPDGNVFYDDDGNFLMIYPEAEPDDPVIEKVSDQIKKRFKDTWTIGNEDIKLFESPYAIGFPDEIDNVEKYNEVRDVIKKALARHNRDVLRVSDLNLKHVEHDKKIDNIVKHALDDGLLEVYYQPIYSPAEKRFTTCEALLRLKDPQLGFISPAVFMPVAEQNGTVIAIDNFVLSSVCDMMANSDAVKYGLKYTEVNLSVVDIIQTNLADNAIRTMEKYGVSPDQLNFEITETFEQGITSVMDENIRKLTEYGTSFSMDDFGTGYSNLARISSLPVDMFKLDKSIVQSAFEDGTNYMVMLNLVKIIKGLKKEIVAEGVETAEQAEQIIRLGCDHIQGFYYSRPLPKAAFIEFLKEHNK